VWINIKQERRDEKYVTEKYESSIQMKKRECRVISHLQQEKRSAAHLPQQQRRRHSNWTLFFTTLFRAQPISAEKAD
jgi:hypothetical protein